MKNKKNKGITLVALVVSIIVLLILSMVSINAIVGENGLITRTQEARLLTLLANFLFDVESEIQDINIDNVLNDKTMNNAEVLDELKKRGTFKVKGTVGESFIMQGYSIDKSSIALDNVELWYNGDVYVDNYKRGKINLPFKSNILESDDGTSTITVNNGTVENYKKDGNLSYYYLHATNPENFAYWIDKYGVCISIFPDTIINVGSNREEEYTAVYDTGLQKTTQRETIVNAAYNYQFFKSGLYGLTSRVINNENGTLTISADDKYLYNSVYVKRSSTSKPTLHQGYMVAEMRVYFSPDKDALVRLKTETSKESDVICQLSRTYSDSNLKMENNFASNEKFNNGGYVAVGDGGKIYLGYENELDTRNFSKLSHSEWLLSIQTLKDFFAGKGYEDVNRLYYCAYCVCYTSKQNEYGANGKAATWELSGYMKEKFEETVKFIDV